MSNLVPINDIEKMALAVAKSQLFGVKTAEQAMALMLIAQAEGMHPAIAARDYHVIQGRPALKADAMMARFQAAGGKVEWQTYTDKEVTGVFSHSQGGSVSITWTFDMATKIGLTGKDNWRNYPRAMLRARCISEGIRTVYPGCIAGTYTDEETEEFAPKEKQAEPKNMGAAEIVADIEFSKEAGANFLPLYIPDNPDPFSNSMDLESWEISFHDMVARVKASQKISDAEKRDKLKRLKEVNQEIIDKMDAVMKMRVMAASNSLEEI